MPTFSHGKATVLYISDGTTAPVLTASGAVATVKVYNVSAYAKQVSFPAKIDMAETSTFGSQVKTFVQGLADRSVTFSGAWEGIAAGISDTTTATPTVFDALLSGLIGATNPVGIVYGPVGSAAGAVKYVASGFLVDYSIQGGISSLVDYSCAFQISGAPTRTTF